MTRVVVTLVNGKRLEVAHRAVPSTPYRLFAVPIAAGQKIAAVDRYVGSRRISHDTFWR